MYHPVTCLQYLSFYNIELKHEMKTINSFSRSFSKKVKVAELQVKDCFISIKHDVGNKTINESCLFIGNKEEIRRRGCLK